METNHRIILGNSARLTDIGDRSIDLVVTSPPYPMIQMWDELFGSLDPAALKALKAGNADRAFERMHVVLDAVWAELHRVVKPGGLVCINVGDAVRTIKEQFRLFSNHARIIAAFQSLGFTQLPAILWRKPTNAPNKFMGSGMLPAGAYVTLEHEYILLFRRGGKREFTSPGEKEARRESAYFWEERNEWFSDIWFKLIGATQNLNNGKSRERSAAYPLEVPYRLINMFSVKGDTVLDPFLGTGTTMLAAMASARHSAGYELDPAFQAIILERVAGLPDIANQIIGRRLRSHAEFIRNRSEAGRDVKNFNHPYNMPVVTRQEEQLRFDPVLNIQFFGNTRFKVIYGAADAVLPIDDPSLRPDQEKVRIKAISKGRQLRLF
jgi:DNA modification methylase